MWRQDSRARVGMQRDLRPRSAVVAIFVSTALVVIVSAALADVLARKDFDGFDQTLW